MRFRCVTVIDVIRTNPNMKETGFFLSCIFHSHRVWSVWWILTELVFEDVGEQLFKKNYIFSSTNPIYWCSKCGRKQFSKCHVGHVGYLWAKSEPKMLNFEQEWALLFTIAVCIVILYHLSMKVTKTKLDKIHLTLKV